MFNTRNTLLLLITNKKLKVLFVLPNYFNYPFKNSVLIITIHLTSVVNNYKNNHFLYHQRDKTSNLLLYSAKTL